MRWFYYIDWQLALLILIGVIITSIPVGGILLLVSLENKAYENKEKYVGQQVVISLDTLTVIDASHNYVHFSNNTSIDIDQLNKFTLIKKENE